MTLRYTGTEGVPFVMGVPARDLTDDDLASLTGGRLGASAAAVRANLIKTGVYAGPSKATPAKAKPSSTKDKE